VEVIGPRTLSISELALSLVRLAKYRELIYTLTLVRLQVRYKQSVLGWIWAVAQPLALMAAYTVIFSKFARIPSQGAPYPLFVLVALLPWTFFASSVMNATAGLIHYGYLLTRVYFPREIIPITYVLTALFDFLVAFVVLASLLYYYRVPVTLHLLWAIPILVVLAVYSTAIALLFSAVQVYFRDVGVAVPVVLQLWMLASPVVYSIDLVPAGLRGLYILNPVAGLIENLRCVVISGRSLHWDFLALSAVLSLGSFLICYVIFKYLEKTFADVI
jgi:lipopolysaccharide transport system permease protein